MTYLSKEKLTEELNKTPMIAQHLDCMDVFDAINNATVDDAVEVVRCKNCKFMYEDDVFQCAIKDGYFPVHEEWFCADGERRTEDA